MIRNIIFDVGKVLVSYEPDAYMQSLGFDEKTRKRIHAALRHLLQMRRSLRMKSGWSIQPSEEPSSFCRMRWNGLLI